ncbi:DUF721 domain-containing protein [Streptomyces sp. NPDC059605]|uniref:DUF721 domain-containing protein n=1 Tax=unclassified Streptomyces TaxID=2593676 RepID=UPI0036B402A1
MPHTGPGYLAFRGRPPWRRRKRPGPWSTIAAAVSLNLPAHVTAVAFHPETGRLDLRPDAPAYTTQLRLISTRIITAANNTVGTQAVHAVRVLAFGATAPKAPRETASAPTATAAEAPVKTRGMASPGFRRALAALQAVTPPQRTDPGVTEAIERQTRALRERSRRAFPDTDTGAVTDNALASIGQVRTERRRQADASLAAALRRARAERGRAASTQDQARYPGAA